LVHHQKQNTMAQQFTPADFSEFKLRVNIKTPIGDAYRAWATPAGLDSWFIGKTVFTAKDGVVRSGEDLLKEGDEYTLSFRDRPDVVILTGKVLKANDKDLFSFTFSKGCPVTVSIYSEHGETIVQLLESNLPTDEETIRKHFVGDTKGWIFYLINLKSVLEGGLDLRNRNSAIRNVITH
jgi:uncharacterized protein YndB with AHSA1/START domain